MEWVICTLVGLVTGAGLTFFVLYRQYRTARSLSDDAAVQFRDAAALSADTRAKTQRLHERQAAFEARVIAYDELVAENRLLKRDLLNHDVSLNKSRLDHEATATEQTRLDERANDLARRYLRDTTKWAFSSLTVNNLPVVRERLVDAFARCRGIGFAVPAADETTALADLQAEYERLVRAAVEREEQARIKTQIREEARLQREAAEELERAARERAVVERALADALARTQGVHSAEIDALRARLAEAEARGRRAVSMAQQTKAGNVYVISNVGAFGPGVYKVGMTRRLEPLERVKELGDASVPFPFDVHLMVSCDDAPALENALHRTLHKSRLNRVNPRKEFFRADLPAIVEVVRRHRGDVQYVADAEALEYRQSLSISDEDADRIEAAFERAEAAVGVAETAED